MTWASIFDRPSKEKPMEPFWVIWSPQGGNPIMKQPTQHAAEEEAKRLAMRNPGREFYILLAFGRTQVKEVEVEWMVDAPRPRPVPGFGPL